LLRFGGEECYGCDECCWDIIRRNLIGISIDVADGLRSSYDTESPFPKLMNDAICLPLFDWGNVGARRRHLERIIAAEDYEPCKGMLA
jgi:hypothetical protein